jgi:hypothetical protein
MARKAFKTLDRVVYVEKRAQCDSVDVVIRIHIVERAAKGFTGSSTRNTVKWIHFWLSRKKIPTLSRTGQ